MTWTQLFSCLLSSGFLLLWAPRRDRLVTAGCCLLWISNTSAFKTRSPFQFIRLLPLGFVVNICRFHSFSLEEKISQQGRFANATSATASGLHLTGTLNYSLFLLSILAEEIFLSGSTDFLICPCKWQTKKQNKAKTEDHTSFTVWEQHNILSQIPVSLN